MPGRHQICSVGDLQFVLRFGLQNPLSMVLLVAADTVKRAADIGRKVVPLDGRKREGEPRPEQQSKPCTQGCDTPRSLEH